MIMDILNKKKSRNKKKKSKEEIRIKIRKVVIKMNRSWSLC